MPITLETFQAEDVDRLMSWIPDTEALHEWSGQIFKAPLTRPQLHSYLESAADPIARRRIYKAIDQASGATVGHIELSHIWPHLSGRMSRVLVGPGDIRGKGIGTEMVRTLVRTAFQEFSFHRLDVGVSTSNLAAIACYERAGFKHVGTWPDAMETADGTINVYWMSMTFGS